MTALDGVQPDIAENIRENGLDQFQLKEHDHPELKGEQVIKVTSSEPTEEELALQQQKRVEEQQKCGEPNSLLESTQASIVRFLSPQMREILKQIKEEPFLVNLMPHLIKFVESKS